MDYGGQVCKVVRFTQLRYFVLFLGLRGSLRH